MAERHGRCGACDGMSETTRQDASGRRSGVPTLNSPAPWPGRRVRASLTRDGACWQRRQKCRAPGFFPRRRAGADKRYYRALSGRASARAPKGSRPAGGLALLETRLALRVARTRRPRRSAVRAITDRILGWWSARSKANDRTPTRSAASDKRSRPMRRRFSQARQSPPGSTVGAVSCRHLRARADGPHTGTSRSNLHPQAATAEPLSDQSTARAWETHLSAVDGR
jgi:hypothetical protein